MSTRIDGGASGGSWSSDFDCDFDAGGDTVAEPLAAAEPAPQVDGVDGADLQDDAPPQPDRFGLPENAAAREYLVPSENVEFRQSERAYRSETEQSVAGRGHVARGGESISSIVGSVDPQAIGNFMLANNLTSDRIEVGRNYFKPDSMTAYGEAADLGQSALNQGNERASAANRSETQRELNRFGAMSEAMRSAPAAIPSAAFERRLLQPGESIRGNLFFGGAGMDGAYITDMVRAFGENGMNLTPVDRNKWSGGTLLDASIGVDIYRAGKFQIQTLLDNFQQTGSQFNLVGYSYGSVAASQVAINYAEAGTRVDNLVLVGSPIDEKFLNQLKSTPNIKNVVVIDLTGQGDPIHAGMTRNELLLSAPTLAKQMIESSGHFYYAPSSPEGQARRNALAAHLYSKGVR